MPRGEPALRLQDNPPGGVLRLGPESLEFAGLLAATPLRYVELAAVTLTPHGLHRALRVSPRQEESDLVALMTEPDAQRVLRYLRRRGVAVGEGS